MFTWNRGRRATLPFARRVLREPALSRQRKRKPSSEPAKSSLVWRRTSSACGIRIEGSRISGVKPDRSSLESSASGINHKLSRLCQCKREVFIGKTRELPCTTARQLVLKHFSHQLRCTLATTPRQQESAPPTAARSLLGE